MSGEWFAELERRANALEGLSTTSSSKYDDFKEWLRREWGAEPAVCFLSDLSKQWTSRVGQALMGLPKLLVLLVRGDSAGDAVDRLAALHKYVTGLQATVLLVGDEGAWKVELVTGASGRSMYDGPSEDGAPQGVEQEDESSERSTEPRGRANFIDLDPLEQADLVWQCLVGRGTLEADEAIRAAAHTLRDDGFLDFERLRRDGPLYQAVAGAISWCTRRGLLFDRPRRDCVRAVIRDADDMDREHWRDCVLDAFGDGTEWRDRDEVVRASADSAVECFGLELQRLRTGGKADTAIRSAINGLIRMGVLERRGTQLLRKARPGRDDEREPEMGPQNTGGDAEAPSSSDMEELPSVSELRAKAGDIPGEADVIFSQLLAMPLRSAEELRAVIASHLAEFEKAFERHHFLDMDGAEQLAADAERLLQSWPLLSNGDRQIAQAAILYFTESDEADDDFRIGGLRTDKLIMHAVKRAILDPRADS